MLSARAAHQGVEFWCLKSLDSERTVVKTPEKYILYKDGAIGMERHQMTVQFSVPEIIETKLSVLN